MIYSTVLAMVVSNAKMGTIFLGQHVTNASRPAQHVIATQRVLNANEAGMARHVTVNVKLNV